MPCSSPRQDPALYWQSHAALLAHIAPAAVLADRATLAEMQAAGLELTQTEVLALEDIGTAEGEFRDQPESAVALLQHSSGTTGLKKGVALSYAAILAQAEAYGASLALSPADVIVSWLPLYHDMGLIACCVLPACLGVPVVHMDAFHWLAKPELLLEAIARHRGTLCWLPNFAFEHLALVAGRHAAKYRLGGMRAFINCSEPCKPASFDRFAAAFATAELRPEALQCCYAMAETVFAATQTALGTPPPRLRLDPATLNRGQRPLPLAEGGVELIACGPPLPGMRLGVFDEARQPLPEGVIGELGLAGPSLFSGYNRDPARSAAQLADGTYFSRDLGFIHAGAVYVLGRVDDLIIINGRNLYAHEVEAEISRIPGVKPGRAVALPLFDERVGSDTLVVIAEQLPEADAETLRRQIGLAVQSVFNVAPRRTLIVTENWLVKTTSGKLSRKENLAKFLAATQGKSTGA